MNTLFKIMIFFRLVDAHDMSLSLTNIAMYVSLFRLCTTPQASYTDVGAMLVTLGNYGYKKYLNQGANSAQKDVNETNS